MYKRNYGFSLTYFFSLCLIAFLFAGCTQKQIAKVPAKIGEEIVFDVFEPVSNVEYTFWNRKQFYQLVEGERKGSARVFFFDESGKFDIAIHYIDQDGSSTIADLFINNEPTGNIAFGSKTSYAGIHKLSGINIQKWSTISFKLSGEGGKKQGIEKLILTRVGSFGEETEDLVPPVTLRIYKTSKEQESARRMLGDFVNNGIDKLMKSRADELTSLKSPFDWMKRQQETRQKLGAYLGEFPSRTPLNAKITGKLEREFYTVEKIVYESQAGYFVTANLYLPLNRSFPVPGVLLSCGHEHPAKAYPIYQETCIGLVSKGYAVLAYDPMGQGERSEYIDMSTGKNIIDLADDQHFYLFRPSYLVGQTIAGLMTWDGIRAIDYMLTRPEIDSEKIAVTGNSGGGMISLLIAAVDERVKVCAAGHPAGPEERTFLKGRDIIERDILSLIAPRPCRIIVGTGTREIERNKLRDDDLRLFNEGLGFAGRNDLILVEGAHNYEKPKRVAAYEWLNKWFDKEDEGVEEPEMILEKPEDLWCTVHGNTIISLNGATGHGLNTRRLDNIYKPIENIHTLKEKIAERTGMDLTSIALLTNRCLNIVEGSAVKGSKTEGSVVKGNESIKNSIVESIEINELKVEKFTIESEEGILIPSLLINPSVSLSGNPLYLYVSDNGKPTVYDENLLPFKLAGEGNAVLCIDVRGTGETSPSPPLVLNQFTGCWAGGPNSNMVQLPHIYHGVNSTSIGRTMAGMRALDIIRAYHFVRSMDGFNDSEVIVIGVGAGALWVLLAAVFEPGIGGVITLEGLVSFREIVQKQYYHPRYHTWIPGALYDFDIPDLVRAISPRKQNWINPVNGLGEVIPQNDAGLFLGSHKNLFINAPLTP